MRIFNRSICCPSLPKVAAIAPSASSRVGEPPPEYKLVWVDEFDHGQLDSTKWSFEAGFIRNNERQLYTDRLVNARVADGVLVIEAHKEKFAIPRRTWRGKYARYTSASLFTKASWKYGRIEVRAKLPHGRGVWPAIWTMGVNGVWPACGEIDVAEYLGRTPDQLYARAHWGRNLLFHRSNGDSLKVSAPWEDFHVYAVEWAAEQIGFFFDEQRYFTFHVKVADRKDGSNPFHQPHRVKLTLALGSWGGKVDDSVLPQKFIIDYVRVYQKVSAGT